MSGEEKQVNEKDILEARKNLQKNSEITLKSVVKVLKEENIK